MIGAEAQIAEGYHALKRGAVEEAIRILKPIPHPRAKALLEEAETRRDAQEASSKQTAD